MKIPKPSLADKVGNIEAELRAIRHTLELILQVLKER